MIRIKITGRNPEYFIKKIIDKGIKYNNLVISLKEIYLDDVLVVDRYKYSWKDDMAEDGNYIGIYLFFLFCLFFILSFLVILFLMLK